MLQVERFFRQCQICCFDNVAVFGNNVAGFGNNDERNFVLSSFRQSRNKLNMFNLFRCAVIHMLTSALYEKVSLSVYLTSFVTCFLLTLFFPYAFFYLLTFLLVYVLTYLLPE